jgi:uncharacterized paraquat-inducible protein A
MMTGINSRQRLILMALAVVLTAMLLFPPFESLVLHGIRLNAGYGFILSPPVYKMYSTECRSAVNVKLLCVQLFVAVAVGAVLFVVAQNRVKVPDDQSPHSP